MRVCVLFPSCSFSLPHVLSLHLSHCPSRHKGQLRNSITELDIQLKNEIPGSASCWHPSLICTSHPLGTPHWLTLEWAFPTPTLPPKGRRKRPGPALEAEGRQFHSSLKTGLVSREWGEGGRMDLFLNKSQSSICPRIIIPSVLR